MCQTFKYGVGTFTKGTPVNHTSIKPVSQTLIYQTYQNKTNHPNLSIKPDSVCSEPIRFKQHHLFGDSAADLGLLCYPACFSSSCSHHGRPTDPSCLIRHLMFSRIQSEDRQETERECTLEFQNKAFQNKRLVQSTLEEVRTWIIVFQTGGVGSFRSVNNFVYLWETFTNTTRRVIPQYFRTIRGPGSEPGPEPGLGPARASVLCVLMVRAEQSPLPSQPFPMMLIIRCRLAQIRSGRGTRSAGLIPRLNYPQCTAPSRMSLTPLHSSRMNSAAVQFLIIKTRSFPPRASGKQSEEERK